MKIQIAMCALGWLICGSAQADIIHVPAEQPDIQTAINMAVNGDEIIVATGTYLETINFLGKAITVRSTDPSNFSVVRDTIIDGGGSGSVVTCSSGEGQNTVLSGFTITGGTGTVNATQTYGGGMYNNNSSPTVTNCTFSGNTLPFQFVGFGGGMFNAFGSSPIVTNCSFRGNTADIGGGMYIGDSSPTVTNCSFSGNTAHIHGGGLYIIRSDPMVTNCTLSGNAASIVGGGIYNIEGSSPTVTNCILWGDSPDEIFNIFGASPNITYSNVQGGYAGIGNINADPRFVDAAGGDYRLQASSPCIDAGNSSAVPAGLTTDMDGKPRFVNDPFTPDTGNGPAPIVDMGLYEFIPSCTVDANSDNVVNVTDLLLLLAAWGPCPFPCPTDANGDGIVNVFDLLTLLAGWGLCG